VNKIIARLLPPFAFFLLAPASHALPHFKKAQTPVAANAYEQYLEHVRAMNPAAPTTTGSLWTDTGLVSNITADYKAHRNGDLVIIHLLDNFTSTTSGENNQSRQFSLSSAITSLFGTLSSANRLQNLANANSSHSLDGKGQSTMSSNVTLNLAAQVMETLPNGVLVVEAARDITLGNDRQTVIVRGLVRPGDLAPDNSVTSTLVSDLQVEIKGKGAVADASRQMNPVVNAFVKLLSF